MLKISNLKINEIIKKLDNDGRLKSSDFMLLISEAISLINSGLPIDAQRDLRRELVDAVKKHAIINTDVQKKIVTIQVCVYNSERFLTDCLFSLINQTYKDIEIIIYDDCSTDSSQEIAIEFQKYDNRIKIFKSKNNSGGPTEGCTFMHYHSRAEFITGVAGDDFLDYRAIEVMVDTLQKNEDIDYVYLGRTQVDQDGRYQSNYNFPQLTSQDFVRYVYKNMSSPIPYSGMFRRDFLIRNNLRHISYQNDNTVCDTINLLQSAKHDVKMKSIPLALSYYRRHDNNLSSDFSRRKEMERLMKTYIESNFHESFYKS